VTADKLSAEKASGDKTSSAKATWSFLPIRFRKSLEKLGFTAPTPVQAAALPKAMAGESFRAIAPTGTGKTLVYLLPMWQLRDRPRAKALVILPTRELAYQVSQMLQDLEPTLRDDIALAIGGHAKDSQLRHIREGWSTLIATPGRLIDLLEGGALSFRSLELVVLDEFDKLVGMGFEEQIGVILKRVPPGAQKILLSATDQEIGAAEKLGLTGLQEVVTEREAGSRNMEETFFFLKSNKKKSELLTKELAVTKGQAIVFVGNRDKANHMQGLLKLRGIPNRALHGHLPQEERAGAYQDFKQGKFRVLVATDLASRGLDMPEVDLIVNYDLPKHYKDYVHRTGRTARRGRAGRCVSFAGPDEYIHMRNLEKEFPGELPVHPAFAQRDRWFEDAKRNHDTEVKLEKRREHIRREQGLED
jgi:superfamily II DNA/RNA helicase